MSKQLKKEFVKMIVTHKCLIKEHGSSTAKPAALGQIVLIPASDVNYLIGIKRCAHYDGPEEPGTIVGEKKKEKKS